MSMHYRSTRGFGDTKSFSDILIEGLAADGGLYVPTELPKLDLQELQHAGYRQVAFTIFNIFAPEIPAEDMKSMIRRVYNARVFGTDEITPVTHLTAKLGILELSNGPTLAFKDVALQILAELLDYVLTLRNDHLNILGSTSGDTGSAAEVAMMGRTRISVYMLSPFGRMSIRQQDQMYTINDPHIHNLIVRGVFDDCQSIVKTLNMDVQFKERYKIGAVNSINWARIVAQIVYYVYGYFRMARSVGEIVHVVVPSGNFGNALAAYIAREMGIPLKVVIATNENDVLDQFFSTGHYRKRPREEVLATMSPSMDIAEASNLERLIYWMLNGNADETRRLYESFKAVGSFHISGRTPSKISGIDSFMTNEEAVRRAIKHAYKVHKRIIEPHTAVAYWQGIHLNRNATVLIAETAKPAKFEQTITDILGVAPPIPEHFIEMAGRERFTTEVANDPLEVKAYIERHAA